MHNWANAVYTISGSGLAQDLGRSGDNITLSNSGFYVTDRYVTNATRVGDVVTLTRSDGLGSLSFNVGGGSSPWTTSGSYVYRNSGVTVGGTSVGNQFRSYLRGQFYDGIGMYDGASLRGEMDIANSAFNIRSFSNHDIMMQADRNIYLTGGNVNLNSDGVSYKVVTASSGNIQYPITHITGGSTFGMAAASVGTIRYVVNATGSSITVSGHTINAGEARGFIRSGSTWYPLQ